MKNVKIRHLVSKIEIKEPPNKLEHMKCIYSKLSNMMELSEQREKSKVEDFPLNTVITCIYM